jgi:hypothetical protein
VESLNAALDNVYADTWSRLISLKIDPLVEDRRQTRNLDIDKFLTQTRKLTRLRIVSVWIPQLPSISFKDMTEVTLCMATPFDLDIFSAPYATLIQLTCRAEAEKGKVMLLHVCDSLLDRQRQKQSQVLRHPPRGIHGCFLCLAFFTAQAWYLKPNHRD